MRFLMILLLWGSVLLADKEKHEEKEGYRYSFESDSLLVLDLSYLELSKEQRDALKKLVKSTKKGMESLRAHPFHAQSRALFEKSSFDESRYETLAMAYEQEWINLEKSFLSGLHAILTPTQRERYALKIQQWRLK